MWLSLSSKKNIDRSDRRSSITQSPNLREFGATRKSGSACSVLGLDEIDHSKVACDTHGDGVRQSHRNHAHVAEINQGRNR